LVFSFFKFFFFLVFLFFGFSFFWFFGLGLVNLPANPARQMSARAVTICPLSFGSCQVFPFGQTSWLVCLVSCATIARTKRLQHIATVQHLVSVKDIIAFYRWIKFAVKCCKIKHGNKFPNFGLDERANCLLQDVGCPIVVHRPDVVKNVIWELAQERVVVCLVARHLCVGVCCVCCLCVLLFYVNFFLFNFLENPQTLKIYCKNNNNCFKKNNIF